MEEERVIPAAVLKIGSGDVLVNTIYTSVSGWSEFFATADWVVEHTTKEALKTYIAEMLMEVEKIKIKNARNANS